MSTKINSSTPASPESMVTGSTGTSRNSLATAKANLDKKQADRQKAMDAANEGSAKKLESVGTLAATTGAALAPLTGGISAAVGGLIAVGTTVGAAKTRPNADIAASATKAIGQASNAASQTLAAKEAHDKEPKDQKKPS